MKTVLKTFLFSAAALLTVSTMAQTIDEQKTEENTVKKHIKIAKVEDGVTMKIDTVITGNGDDMAWFGDGEFDDFFEEGKRGMPPHFPDSLLRDKMKRFRFEFNDDQDGRHPRMRMFAGPDDKEIMREFEFKDDDSTRHMIIMHGDNEDCNFGSRMAPQLRRPQQPQRIERMMRRQNQNLIDLNDPDIISFERKELRGGREKIEIIRKKPTEKQVQVETEVIIDKESKK